MYGSNLNVYNDLTRSAGGSRIVRSGRASGWCGKSRFERNMRMLASRVASITLLVYALSCAVGLSAFPQADSNTSRAAMAILEKQCLGCHGAGQMSGLDLRQRETLLKGGKRGPAIIPGNPEGSLLYKAVAHQGDLKMPLGSGSPLPREQLEILKKWIKDGAPWPTNYAVA